MLFLQMYLVFIWFFLMKFIVTKKTKTKNRETRLYWMESSITRLNANKPTIMESKESKINQRTKTYAHCTSAPVTSHSSICRKKTKIKNQKKKITIISISKCTLYTVGPGPIASLSKIEKIKIQQRECVRKMSWCALKPFHVPMMKATRAPLAIGGVGCASVIGTGLWRRSSSSHSNRSSTPAFASLNTFTFPCNFPSLSLSQFLLDFIFSRFLGFQLVVTKQHWKLY